MSIKKNEPNTFTSHLVELRQRLIYCFVSLFIIFAISYTFAEHIYSFLVHPYADAVQSDIENRRLIFTALQEAFLTYLKVSFFVAIFFDFLNNVLSLDFEISFFSFSRFSFS